MQSLELWPALIAAAACASIPGRCNIILHLVAEAGIQRRQQIRYGLGSHNKPRYGIFNPTDESAILSDGTMWATESGRV